MELDNLLSRLADARRLAERDQARVDAQRLLAAALKEKGQDTSGADLQLATLQELCAKSLRDVETLEDALRMTRG